MDDREYSELSAWITEVGLAGQGESAILAAVCDRLVTLGLPLARALVLIDTLHPFTKAEHFAGLATRKRRRSPNTAERMRI